MDRQDSAEMNPDSDLRGYLILISSASLTIFMLVSPFVFHVDTIVRLMFAVVLLSLPLSIYLVIDTTELVKNSGPRHWDAARTTRGQVLWNHVKQVMVRQLPVSLIPFLIIWSVALAVLLVDDSERCTAEFCGWLYPYTTIIFALIPPAMWFMALALGIAAGVLSKAHFWAPTLLMIFCVALVFAIFVVCLTLSGDYLEWGYALNHRVDFIPEPQFPEVSTATQINAMLPVVLPLVVTGILAMVVAYTQIEMSVSGQRSESNT